MIALQWARALRNGFIATVSTEKAAVAKAESCARTIVKSRKDIATRALEIAEGKGVSVV